MTPYLPLTTKINFVLVTALLASGRSRITTPMPRTAAGPLASRASSMTSEKTIIFLGYTYPAFSAEARWVWI
jgi:hypothetical protein